jgi:hypothetical protein
MKIDQLQQFIEEEWDEQFAYTARDIADLLQWNTKVARYYLLILVQRGYLRQLKYWGKTWYIKDHQVAVFKRFKFLRIL